MEISQNFVAFSEYMNFTKVDIFFDCIALIFLPGKLKLWSL